MDERYDVAIIGSGPAGLSAAINAKIRNKNIIVFGNKHLSKKLIKAPKVKNYLGIFDITGKKLKEAFEKHIHSMKIRIKHEKITSVYAMGEYFSLMVNDKVYEAKTVIIATGMEYGKLINGEDKFLGKGVGYCATCDAPLYKDKVVTIIGYNREAEEEANFVSELASKIYYIPMYKDKYKLNNSIELVHDTPVRIDGNNSVKKVVLENEEINTDGVFIIKDSISLSQLVPGLEVENYHIKVDKDMHTNIPGCFAAGDCTGTPYQYIKSAGEGQVAALNAVSFLNSLK